MSPIIHIGFPKTATTWLQKEFFPNVKNIEFIDRKTVGDKIVKPNTFEINTQETRIFFESKKANKLFICDEMLVGGMDAGFGNGAFIKEVGYRLKNIFDQAQIIIFIRNQHSMVASAYFQYLIEGGNYSIDRFLNRKKMFGIFLKEYSLFSFDFFKFDQTISFYKSLFGENNVDVYLFEEFDENPKDFLTKFKEKYDLDIDINSLNFEKKRNKRYRKYLLQFAKISNSFTHSNTLLKYYIFNIPKFHGRTHNIYRLLNKYRLFGAFPTDLHLLGAKNMKYISEFYKESNRKLIEIHGLESIKKYNYPL